MSEDIESYIGKGKNALEDTLNHLSKELIKIRAGRADVSMLDGIKVEYYGSPTPLSQVSNITTPDSKTLAIQPWEKSLLANIEQAIFAANIGLTPMNDGEFVRITIPPMTEERRRDLVKQSKSAGEDAKISLRQSRQKMMDFINKEVKDGYPEDAGKRKKDHVEGMIKEYSAKIDKLIESKEKDIMTV